MSPKIQLSIWKLKSSQQSCQNQIWNQMKQISTDRDWSSQGRYSSQYAICFRVGCLAIICRLPWEYLRIKIKIFDWYISTTILLGKIYIFTSIKSQFISFTAKSNSIWEHFISNFQHFPLCCVWEAISFSVRNFYLCEVHSYFEQTHMFIRL